MSCNLVAGNRTIKSVREAWYFFFNIVPASETVKSPSGSVILIISSSGVWLSRLILPLLSNKRGDPPGRDGQIISKTQPEVLVKKLDQ